MRTDSSTAAAESALLDTTALLVAYCHGGAVPRAAAPPQPVVAPPAGTTTRRDSAPAGTLPPEEYPSVPRAAAGRLAALLQASDTTGPLRAWLTTAAQAGLLAPPGQLPDLLDAAAADKQLREFVTVVAGRRGRWLAAQRSNWAKALTPEITTQDPSQWTRGETTSDRLDWLRAARSHDPALARTAIETTWSSEPADVRRGVVELIRDEPDPPAEDATLLGQAMTDRAASVRQAAADALSRLPDSAFAREIAAAGLPCVTFVDDGVLPRLVARRDPDPPPDLDRWSTVLTGDNGQAGTLEAVFAHVSLQAWEDRFGLTAHELAALSIHGNAADELRRGWQRAALIQRNARWAEAMLASRQHIMAEAVLLRVVPPPRRTALVAACVNDLILDNRGRSALDLCPAPWPAELWQAVVARVLAPGATYQTVAVLLGTASTKVGVEAVTDLNDRTAALPDKHPVRLVLDRVAAEVALLATIRAEILADAHQEGQ